jgi:uncharacterized membrane protein YdbT with pleckstrin-like domain
MSSYIKKNLLDNEKIIYEGKVSIWSLLPLIILGVVTIFTFGLGLIFFLAAYLRYISTEVAYTNKRVIAKFGFISRETVELNINKVESMQVKQGIIGRIFNFGSLVISGAGNPQAPIPGISHPMMFRRSLMEYHDRLQNN